jgi:hypothetical protein
MKEVLNIGNNPQSLIYFLEWWASFIGLWQKKVVKGNSQNKYMIIFYFVLLL